MKHVKSGHVHPVLPLQNLPASCQLCADSDGFVRNTISKIPE